MSFNVNINQLFLVHNNNESILLYSSCRAAQQMQYLGPTRDAIFVFRNNRYFSEIIGYSLSSVPFLLEWEHKID